MATKEDFLLEYPKFVQQYGVLFEKNEASMTEKERKTTLGFYWVILFFFVLFSGLGGATYYFNSSKGITIGMAGFVLFEVVTIGYLYYYLRRILKRGKKWVIKAVVTSKKSGKSEDIGLSYQEYVSINSTDYSALNYGDIIQIDKVGTSVTFAISVTKIGSIFDPSSIRNS